MSNPALTETQVCQTPAIPKNTTGNKKTAQNTEVTRLKNPALMGTPPLPRTAAPPQASWRLLLLLASRRPRLIHHGSSSSSPCGGSSSSSVTAAPPHSSWRLLLPSRRQPRCTVGAAIPAHASRGGTTPPSSSGRGRRRPGMPGVVVSARRTSPPCGAHGNPVRAGEALSRAAAAILRAARTARAPAPPPRAAPARRTMQIFVKTLTGKTITLEVSRRRRAAPPLPAGAPKGRDVPAGSGMCRERPGCAGETRSCAARGGSDHAVGAGMAVAAPGLCRELLGVFRPFWAN